MIIFFYSTKETACTRLSAMACPIAEFAGHLSPSDWVPMWLEQEAARVRAANAEALAELEQFQRMTAEERRLRTSDLYTEEERSELELMKRVPSHFDLLPEHRRLIERLEETSADLGLFWVPCACYGCDRELFASIRAVRDKLQEDQRLAFVARALCRRRAVN